jgi:hypothetical protein
MLGIRRREFITLLGGAAAWPLAVRAQQGERMRRIGVLMNVATDIQDFNECLAAFQQALQELGWTLGRNVRIDTRWAADDAERLRSHAAELVTLAPDAVLAQGSLSVAASGKIKNRRRPGRPRPGRKASARPAAGRPEGTRRPSGKQNQNRTKQRRSVIGAGMKRR